jgi:hypothetical protein
MTLISARIFTDLGLNKSVKISIISNIRAAAVAVISVPLEQD